MKNFSYLNKPISEATDSELASWLCAFLNGAPLEDEESMKEWDEFWAEIPNRTPEFQEEINYINSVL